MRTHTQTHTQIEREKMGPFKSRWGEKRAIEKIINGVEKSK